MPTLDRFLRYDELTAELHALVEEHPSLLAVESIGRSHEGRDVWLVTVTDEATGPHDTKPAHWVDASIHAVELTACVAALHLLDRLVSGHGKDPVVTRALRTRTFYVVPRVNPDGAELALADRPRFVRSSVRRWPWRDGHVPPGLAEGDVDGDGRLLSMRIADPDGGWREHPDEPRLMVRRAFDEPGGPGCYRLLAEGTVTDHDGFTVPTPSDPESLDLNRNFPAGWGTKVQGSGDYPGSEPETAALLAAVMARPNVCGYNAFHTSGGVLLRPSSTRPDSELPPVDIWTWTELGRRCTELTSYPVHSLYEDFTWDKSKLMSGAADDWAYDHLGVYSWTTEFWDVIAVATGERAHTGIWVTGPTVEQELGVLRWADEHFPGEVFVDWYTFDHPQLGPIELGGWDWLRSWINPPAGPPGRGGGWPRRLRHRPGPRLAARRAAAGRGAGARRGDMAGAGRHRQHGLVADDGDGAGPQGGAGVAGRGRADRASRARGARRGGPPGARAARRPPVAGPEGRGAQRRDTRAGSGHLDRPGACGHGAGGRSPPSEGRLGPDDGPPHKLSGERSSFRYSTLATPARGA